ncbi:PC-Esterase domain-containing protein/PMR5N domain-containing protein [Cephalotus follicularis]|uniref:PC-Esterase domain-containing protein/PMR5N domain-containing protein n=1 Tax=Cephalotus follicularis TaxID=3775 RepID=A0A1Q3B862_CEPFO|nr:PC-Esterase domain-containing protein/PMR5N domain-containing protein [Cephalotus follicularis]
MEDVTKHNLHVGGGTLIKDLKSLLSIIKTRRTVVFVYGNNKNNSSTSPQQQQEEAHNFTSSLPTKQNTTTTAISSGRSQDPIYQSPNANTKPPSNQNTTQTTDNSNKDPILHANDTVTAPSVSKQPPKIQNQTQKTDSPEVLNPHKTSIAAPKIPVPANQSVNSTSNSVSLVKGSSNEVENGKEMSNNTASLSKKQSNGTKQGNGTDAGVSAVKHVIESLMGCDLFDGNWIRDDSYPLYRPLSCSFIDEQFNCIKNGRADKDYQKYKWKPKSCTLPRLDGGALLDLLRGKRLVFVGDSLNRNMWESLVCILKNSVKDQSKVYEANGRQHFRGEASYSFVFQDYGCSVEFFVSPFLVQEWEMPDENGTKKETLRLDLIGRYSDQYKSADIIVFNTGHWWTHDKTSKGKDYYQEGSHVYGELNVLEAFRKALTTWARWVDANVNPMKSLVFFRGYSASHFSGGQWNSGGACDNETEPINNDIYLKPYPPKMTVLESVLKGMKTHVTYLNITRLTDYRKDGHPSIYRDRRTASLRFQDCSHWCLPGVPDSWNEIFYAKLLVKQYQDLQKQKRP